MASSINIHVCWRNPNVSRWDQDPRTTVRSPSNHIDHIAIYIYSSLSIYLCQYKSPYGPYLVLNSKILTMSCRSGFGLKIGCPIPFSGYIIIIFPITKIHFQNGYSWLYILIKSILLILMLPFPVIKSRLVDKTNFLGGWTPTFFGLTPTYDQPHPNSAQGFNVGLPQRLLTLQRHRHIDACTAGAALHATQLVESTRSDLAAFDGMIILHNPLVNPPFKGL